MRAEPVASWAQGEPVALLGKAPVPGGQGGLRAQPSEAGGLPQLPSFDLADSMGGFDASEPASMLTLDGLGSPAALSF